MSEETDVENVDLTDFSQQEKPSEPEAANAAEPDETPPQPDDDTRTATDLEAVYDVPVNITAVLGRTNMEVANLLKLDEGDVVELDRKVGEAIDIFVNNRLVARGEVVLVEDRLGVTMTEIIRGNA
jgi:flagellar motor switch protein FliN/FliY